MSSKSYETFTLKRTIPTGEVTLFCCPPDKTPKGFAPVDVMLAKGGDGLDVLGALALFFSKDEFSYKLTVANLAEVQQKIKAIEILIKTKKVSGGEAKRAPRAAKPKVVDVRYLHQFLEVGPGAQTEVEIACPRGYRAVNTGFDNSEVQVEPHPPLETIPLDLISSDVNGRVGVGTLFSQDNGQTEPVNAEFGAVCVKVKR